MDTEENYTFMTYAEAAAAMSIKGSSIRRRAAARRWPKREGPNGLALVGIPIAAYNPEARKTKLYRHFSATGELLYVGISIDLPARINNHREESHWFESVATITIETFTDRRSAMVAERDAIMNERPLHNIIHSRLSYHPQRPVDAHRRLMDERAALQHAVSAEKDRALARQAETIRILQETAALRAEVQAMQKVSLLRRLFGAIGGKARRAEAEEGAVPFASRRG